MLFSFLNDPVTLLLMIPAVIIALTVHEYAHARIADRLGDPTPRAMGRMTLNPMKHLNPLGAICLLIVGFGWANPVPINSRYFKNPRKGMAAVAAAGPASNLILSFLGALLYVAMNSLAYQLAVRSAIGITAYQFLLYCGIFFYLFHLLNLSFCIFNLLPLPPLDGSRLLTLILPQRAAVWVYRHEKQLYLTLLLWLIIGSVLYRILMSVPMISGNAVLSTIVKILSLSGWLSDFVSLLSRLMLKLFLLIPIFG